VELSVPTIRMKAGVSPRERELAYTLLSWKDIAAMQFNTEFRDEWSC